MIAELDYLVLSGLSYGNFRKEDIGLSLEETLFINKGSKNRLLSFPNEVWPYGGAEIFEKTLHNFLCEWKVLRIMDDTYHQGKDKTGFYAIAFEKHGQVIIAYRGTEVGSFGEAYKDFIETDLLIGMDKKPKQLDQGVEFYEEIVSLGYKKISLTGHSLGGGIAQYVALISDLKYQVIPKVYTWNAVGLNKVGVLTIEDFVNFDSLVDEKFPILKENPTKYKKLKTQYYNILLRALKKKNYIRGRENIKRVHRENFKLELEPDIEKKVSELLTIDNKSKISFFKNKENGEVESRELIISPNKFLSDFFNEDKIYDELAHARRFISKFRKNDRYNEYIINFVHSKDFTITLYTHLGSTYAVDKGLKKVGEELHPLLKKVYAFTKSFRNYHMYSVFLPFFTFKGKNCGKISSNINLDYVAGEIRKVIYSEKNLTDEFLGSYYNRIELTEKNYYSIKKVLLHGLGESKLDIKYLEESVVLIKRMEYEEFKKLWKKVINKMGSPFIKTDIYDLIIFHNRHK